MTDNDRKELIYILSPLMFNNFLQAQKNTCEVIKIMLKNYKTTEQQINFLDAMLEEYNKELEKLKNDK